MFERIRSKGIGALLCAVMVVGYLPLATSGCIGSFELTRKLYRFNLDLDEDKYVQWMAFVVMNVVPVYGFALVVDAVFANSVEFWTGENPILVDAGNTRVVHGPGGETVRARRIARGIVELELTDPAGNTRSLRMVAEPQTLAAYGAHGELLARVGQVDGRPALLRR